MLSVRNLFGFRATEPKELLTCSDPVGPLGDSSLRVATTADLVIAAWGAKVPFGREESALGILSIVDLYCLQVTKEGKPRHPLYCRQSLQPSIYRLRRNEDA